MGKKTRIDELRPSQAVRKRRTRTLFFDLATLDRSTNRNRAMKYSSALLLFSSTSADSPLARTRRQAPDQDARRYKQLTAQMQYYNADFDERKYWTYGCQCLILGDRPMSDPGHGPPIDELDSVCKQYKDCQKCARMRHGEFCIGEFVEYGLRWNRNSGAPVCKDDDGLRLQYPVRFDAWPKAGPAVLQQSSWSLHALQREHEAVLRQLRSQAQFRHLLKPQFSTIFLSYEIFGSNQKCWIL